MEKDVFNYLGKNYRYLNRYISEINKTVIISPQNSMIKGKLYIENLTKELCNLENYGLMSKVTQEERLAKLYEDKIINEDINSLFKSINNTIVNSNIKGDLEESLNMHKKIYEITAWFIYKYIDSKFEEVPYKVPKKALVNVKEEDLESINKIINKVENSIVESNVNDNEIIKNEVHVSHDSNEIKKDIKYELLIESILNNNVDKKCLIQELLRLKKSSNEIVEGNNEFTPFKKYMHIERAIQRDLEEVILKAEKSKKAQLILLCGNVGDGKSHIISYFNNKYSDIMENFKIYNVNKENLSKNISAVDNLTKALHNFNDDKINKSNDKVIITLNIETLEKFIKSENVEKFSILNKYIEDNKILKTSRNINNFDEDSFLKFINFSDYHMFTLKNGKVEPNYIELLINKITDSSEYNIFYDSYKKNCIECKNSKCCPIKGNYELLSNENVKKSIAQLLVQCSIENTIEISTRELLNFIYELLVPDLSVDSDSELFKKTIHKLNNLDYINALLPNKIFSNKENSFIFEALNKLDPINISTLEIEDIREDFENSIYLFDHFKKFLDYPNGYMDKIYKIDFEKSKYKKIRAELLKFFIRSYYFCGKGDMLYLKDYDYEDYMKNVYRWNKGDVKELKPLYNNMMNALLKLKNKNGDTINENIKIKGNTTNIPINSKSNLEKFNTTLELKYDVNENNNAYNISLDFPTYKKLAHIISKY